MIRIIQEIVTCRATARRADAQQAQRTARRAALAWLRGPLVLAAAALLATSVAGCGPQRLKGACGIVVDGSYSGNAATGFDADKQLHSQLDSFLSSAGCRYVVFAPINGASQQSICSAPELDMDPDVQGDIDRQALHQAAYKAAMRRAEAVLTCARTDPRSISGASDIVGGLDRIAQARPPVPGPYNVLVVSDFINWTVSLRLSRENLTTEASRSALINRLASQGLLPDFHGAHVYAVGFGALSSRNPARFPDFSAFWHQFMSRAQAEFQTSQQ
jgi:hypothetical protein